MIAYSGKRTNERGFALVMTVLIVVIVGSLVAGATLIGSNHLLVNSYYDRASELEFVADGGLEWARARLNADTIYPDSGYITMENGAAVQDGNGNTIPGVRRWIYAGPSGLTSGQYGVFGSIIAVVQSAGGGRVIRRSQVFQESFSKYAYFTDNEPSSIRFGCRDQLFGPVHSNSPIRLYAPCSGDSATFHGPVTTAQDIQVPNYGSWRQGFQEAVTVIPMPATAELTRLQAQAVLGSTAFTGDSNGGTGEATTRIEFVAVDLNGDGDRTDDDEGFIRVYQSSNAAWVTATTNEENGPNCGDYDSGVFYPTNVAHPVGHNMQAALMGGTAACYLGGADELGGGFRATTDGYGQWLQNPNPTPPALLATTRADSAYLFPISRALNPDFKGVIHVTGKVVISGEVRGRVTVAATDDIIIGDDITYITDPAAGTCVDIAGYFAGDDVIVADNTMNAPRQIGTGGGAPWRTLGPSKDEFIHGTVLALDIFTVQNYNSGASDYEDCEGANNGRGCLYLTGGIIQTQRGAVGLTSGQGYIKRYAYDACGATSPPPYFPTTGVFARGHYYQVDPAGFDIDAYFALITP